MLLIEKMETALESTEIGELISNVRSGNAFKDSKSSIQKFVSTTKQRIEESVPFANRKELQKLEKKIASLNRKLNKLRKEFNEL